MIYKLCGIIYKRKLTFLNEVKVNFYKSMNCFLTSLSFLFRCNTECIYCHSYKQIYGILYSAICKLYDIIYAPQFFHERQYNSKKEILLATCTCI